MNDVVSGDARLADLADAVLNVSREIRARGDGDAVALTITEGNVMRFVDRHPGATPGELAEGTGLQRSNLSTTLRALEEKGLVERQHDSSDGRTIRVTPTDRAAENLRALRDNWTALLGEALDGRSAGVDDALALLIRLEEGLVRSRRT